jgi:hypothetical protein
MTITKNPLRNPYLPKTSLTPVKQRKFRLFGMIPCRQLGKKMVLIWK